MAREWTDEQRSAQADKMREAQKKRWASHGFRKPAPGPTPVVEGSSVVATGGHIGAATGVQGVDVLVGVQEVGHTTAVVDVSEEARKILAPVFSPAPSIERIGSREVNLVVRTDGTMVSLLGPCVCGVPKREWHKLCLIVGERPVPMNEQMGHQQGSCG